VEIFVIIYIENFLANLLVKKILKIGPHSPKSLSNIKGLGFFGRRCRNECPVDAETSISGRRRSDREAATGRSHLVDSLTAVR